MRLTTLLHGDSREILKNECPDEYFDALLTDPPYEIGFFQSSWDATGISFDPEFWKLVHAKLKPGAHGLIFGAPRTFHRMMVAVEDAGFEIRDTLMWLYSSMPKGLNPGKAFAKQGNPELAQTWEGWNTNLKPCYEPVVLVRKPVDGSVLGNLERWGVGAINVDACRIGNDPITINRFDDGAKPFGDAVGAAYSAHQVEGRYPGNVILSEEAGAFLDLQAGTSKSKRSQRGKVEIFKKENSWIGESTERGYDDEGGKSRFYYCPKSSKREKSLGLDEPNTHKTVKPLDLLRYLSTLICPPGCKVLDPFMGSGSTGIVAAELGLNYVGIELEEEYVRIAHQRIEHHIAANRL